MEKGIAFSDIITQSFYKKTYVQNQIMGRALLESVTFLHGRCIFSVVRKKDMDFYGVDSNDMDGIVDQLRITEGVECAIFMYETNSQEFKVSMRSNHVVDVSKIAAYFGGGGHIRAAGCTMSGRIHDVVNNLSLHIAKQLEERDKECTTE
ncbi:DHHA1 domain-containing protein [Clostridium sp. AM58-1XD]|uniref:DHH family phosphoesterase n=1 Tax=Clostridium sp. AM58-1XD TaxID=2292307 RepID=UPI00269C182F